MTIAADWLPLADMLDMLAAGAFQRNVFFGGSGLDLNAESTGTFDLQPYVPIGVDNRNSQITAFSGANGGTLVHQVRYFVQVSNSAITITPKVYDIDATALATVSGNTACSATSEAFSGTDQQQTLVLTLPAAYHFFKPQVTIAGTPAPGYTYRAWAIFDTYIHPDAIA